jgi:hypothetical protein
MQDTNNNQTIGIDSGKIRFQLNTDTPKACAFIAYLEYAGAIVPNRHIPFAGGGQGKGRGTRQFMVMGTAGVVVFGTSILIFNRDNAKSEAAKTLPLINSHNFTATSADFLSAVGNRKPWASNLVRLLESSGYAENIGFDILTLTCPKTGVVFTQKRYIYNIQPIYISWHGEISLAKTALSRLLRE